MISITWVLVLAIMAPGTQGGSSIAAIPGFSSLERCKTAAELWKKGLPTSSWSSVSAICMAVN